MRGTKVKEIESKLGWSFLPPAVSLLCNPKNEKPEMRRKVGRACEFDGHGIVETETLEVLSGRGWE